VRDQGDRSRPEAGAGAGSAGSGTAGGLGVGETAVAMPGTVMSDCHLDGDPPPIELRRSVTERARAEICRRVGEDEEVGRSGSSGLTGGLSRLR